MAEVTIRARYGRAQAAAAREAGRTRYFTGHPCKNGHIAERMLSNRQCCECLAERRRQHIAAKPEIRRASKNGNRAANLEEHRRLGRERYAKRSPVYAERMREYRAANPDRIRATKRRTYEATYDKILARNRKRRAQERDAPGGHTVEDIVDIRRLQGDRCAICSKALKGRGQVDHIIALVKGGSDDRSNLQLACGPCNSRKRDKDPITFMRERGLLL